MAGGKDGSGAGAGGFRTNFPTACGVDLTVQGYPIVVGGGGNGGGGE